MDDVTADLAVHYAAWKDNEKAKNADKDRFFALATEICAEGDREEILASTGPVGRGASEDQAIGLLEEYNPRFEVDALRPTDEGWEAIMVLRPEFMAFTYVGRDLGMVFQRQIVPGSPVLDDARLANDEPDLYAKVTFELPWGGTIVRPLDALEPQTLALVQNYVHEGKPTVKLAAPRPAKDEELESVAA